MSRTARVERATAESKVLVEVDPRRGTHVPVAFPAGGQEALTALLDRLHEVPKRPFHPDQPAAEVRRILDDVGPGSAGQAGPGRIRAARSFLRRS